MRVVAALSILLIVACDGGAGSSDAGPSDSEVHGDAGDDGVVIAAPNIDWLEVGQPPIAAAARPTFGPCPDGWETQGSGDESWCMPLAEVGTGSCAPGQAHFLGEVACGPVGDACPVGDYSASLPTVGTVIYVDPDATSVGDGSRALPFDALSDVSWNGLAPGTTVALAKGTHDGELPLRRGVSVVGACAAGTTVRGSDVFALVSVTSAGAPASIRNVTVIAQQRGAQVDNGEALVIEGVVFEGAEGFAVFATGAGTDLTISDSVIRDTRPLADDTFGRALSAQSGARVEATRLVVAGGHDAGIFVSNPATAVTLSDVVVRDVQPLVSTGGRGRGIETQDGAALTATRLLVSGNREYGVTVLSGSSADLAHTVVRDTETDESSGMFGVGILVWAGARLTASQSTLTTNHSAGLWVGGDGTQAALTDVVVRDTLPSATVGGDGRGIDVRSGARLDATRLLLVGNRGVGLIVDEAGTEAALADVIVRDTLPGASDADNGQGIVVQEGASLEVTRLLAVNNNVAGVAANGAGASARVTDAIVEGTLAPPGEFGFGAGVYSGMGALLVAERLLVVRCQRIGALAIISGEMDVTDGAIVDTVPAHEDDEWGDGMVASVGSRLSATRVLVQDSKRSGINAWDSVLTLTDVVIRGTHPAPAAVKMTRALSLGTRARASADRLLIDDTAGAGILALQDETEIVLRDVRVRDTREDGVDSFSGFGILAWGFARVTGGGVVVERAQAFGVLVLREGTLDLERVAIRGVVASGCAETTCTEAPAGHGVGVVSGAVRLSDFSVEEAAYCGVFVGSVEGEAAPSLDLSRGVVSRSTIGACIQNPDYDLQRLTDGVEYRDNVTNLDARALDVPDLQDDVVIQSPGG